MTNSTLSVECDGDYPYSTPYTFPFNKNWSGMKRDYSVYLRQTKVNETYAKDSIEYRYKLTKEQEQQFEEFKKTTNGKSDLLSHQ